MVTFFKAVTCGAVSGFHATQSPMIAKCIKSEKDGRQIFYGAMGAEGIIALIIGIAITLLIVGYYIFKMITRKDPPLDLIENKYE